MNSLLQELFFICQESIPRYFPRTSQWHTLSAKFSELECSLLKRLDEAGQADWVEFEQTDCALNNLAQEDLFRCALALGLEMGRLAGAIGQTPSSHP